MGPDVGVGAVVIADLADERDPNQRASHVVLIRRGRPPFAGRWTLPGGRVERGETLESALRRELKEETALDVTMGPLVEVVELIDEGDLHYIIMDYVAHFTGDSRSLRAGDDAQDARWVRLDELATYGVTAAVHRVVEQAKAMKT